MNYCFYISFDLAFPTPPLGGCGANEVNNPPEALKRSNNLDKVCF